MNKTPITTQPAFGAYLTLGRPEGRSPDAVAHFEQAFIGAFPSTSAFIAEYLDARGAQDALDAFRAQAHLPQQWLRCDEEAVLALLRTKLEPVESGGQIYVFAK